MSKLNDCHCQFNDDIIVNFVPGVREKSRLTMRSGPHSFLIQSGPVTFVLPTLNADFNSVTV